MDSVWSVWWHPRRALDEMVEMRRENEELRKQLEENRRVRTELQAGLSESRRVQEDLTELRRTLEGEVARLQGLNADQAQRLKDWEDAQSEMERVAAKWRRWSVCGSACRRCGVNMRSASPNLSVSYGAAAAAALNMPRLTTTFPIRRNRNC